MQMIYKKLFVFVLFLMVLTTKGISQTGSISPYSRYGIGDVLPEGFTYQLGMGGIGAALISPNQINFINPASLAYDTITIFDFAANGEIRRLERNTQNSTLNSASFSYFSLAFPVIKNKMGMSFGLLPFSSVGYNINVFEEVQNVGIVKYRYEGEGGFNKVFLASGIKVFNGLSAGVNASYVFGTIENRKSIEFPYNVNYFNSRYINDVTAKGFYFNYGLLYNKLLKNEKFVSVGLTSSLSTGVNASNVKNYYNYAISGFGGEIVKDSIYEESEKSGKIRLPDYYRAGVSYGKTGKWMAGADFSYNNWEKFRNFDSKDSLKNSYTFSLGGEYQTKKLIYRLGGRYTQTYLSLNNNQLNDYGITFGLSILKMFPKRPPSAINIAVELGSRGTTESNLIKENYIRLNLGFTLTDIWFIKSKYD